MTDTRGVWKESFRVRSYETTPHARASLPAVCNYLQEAASNHAHDLGVSIEHLEAHNVTWVLSKLRVVVDRYPHWREQLIVETWPSGQDGLFATREFILWAEDDVPVGRATSRWLLIDRDRRRPTRIPDFIKAIALPPRDVPVPSVRRKMTNAAFVGPGLRIDVRFHDLDLNQHVNNVHYVEWAAASVPEDLLGSHEVADFEIHFLAETTADDTLVAQVARTGNGPAYLHHLRRADDGTDVARAQSRWRPVDDDG